MYIHTFGYKSRCMFCTPCRINKTEKVCNLMCTSLLPSTIVLFFTILKTICFIDKENRMVYNPVHDEERQVTKPTSPVQSCRLRTEFLHSRSRSIAVTPDTMCRAFF